VGLSMLIKTSSWLDLKLKINKGYKTAGTTVKEKSSVQRMIL